MKRLVISAILLSLCLALPASLGARDKKPAVDMSGMKHIFLGWIDLGSDNYRRLGYSFREDWDKIIERENLNFQQDFQSNLPTGRTVSAAKNKEDVNTTGNDLYIKFTDVAFEPDHTSAFTTYTLHISVHFIDLKTNTEIASIPDLKLDKSFCTLKKCLSIDLNEMNEQMQLLIVGDEQTINRNAR
jgi:hypothetical protein